MGQLSPLYPDVWRCGYGRVAGFFEEVLDDYKLEHALAGDADLEADDWQSVVERYLEVIDREAEAPFPKTRWNRFGAIAPCFKAGTMRAR